MANAKLEVVSVGDQDLPSSTPSPDNHNVNSLAEISTNNPSSENAEQTDSLREATSIVQAQCSNPGMPVIKVQPFLTGKEKTKP